jgi:hypothetical protein
MTKILKRIHELREGGIGFMAVIEVVFVISSMTFFVLWPILHLLELA